MWAAASNWSASTVTARSRRPARRPTLPAASTSSIAPAPSTRSRWAAACTQWWPHGIPTTASILRASAETAPLRRSHRQPTPPPRRPTLLPPRRPPRRRRAPPSTRSRAPGTSTRLKWAATGTPWSSRSTTMASSWSASTETAPLRRSPRRPTAQAASTSSAAPTPPTCSRWATERTPWWPRADYSEQAASS